MRTITHGLGEMLRAARWVDAPRPALHELFSFGGGAHRCIGSHLATTKMTVMLALLLAQGPFRWVPHRIRASGFAALHPSRLLPAGAC